MSVRILIGDCRERLRELPDASVNCCVTSPPYFGLRDYGHAGQMGLEPTPDEFVAGMVEVFREVRRVLRDDGTLWLNIGDSYNSGPSGSLSGSTLGGGQANQAKSNRAWRNGSGRADGVVDERGQRNRDGVRAAGLKPKDLIGIPWLLAFALRADGWFLRQDIIWSKPNPMPESVRDRCTKAHEYLFLLSKSPRYFYDAEAIAEASTYAPGQTTEVERAKGYYGGKWAVPGDGSRNDGSFKAIRETRNKRSVWDVATQPFSEAHFATYPPALIEPCILAGCPKGGVVIDPFFGAGTTGLVADRLQRDCIGIELNPEYAEIAQKRIQGEAGMFGEVLAA